jgi:hypothetical protein
MLSTFLEKYTKRTSSQFIDFPNQQIVNLELEITFSQRGENEQLLFPGKLNPFKEVVGSILECDLLPVFQETSNWERLSTLVFIMILINIYCAECLKQIITQVLCALNEVRGPTSILVQ